MTTSPNRAYLTWCLTPSLKFPPRETSDTLGTLSEMSKPALEIEKYKEVRL